MNRSNRSVLLILLLAGVTGSAITGMALGHSYEKVLLQSLSFALGVVIAYKLYVKLMKSKHVIS